MSNALAIASVTAVLKDLLDNALIDHSAAVDGPVIVDALAPDRIKTGEEERAQLNLFLYHVTPNLGWRNVGLPSRDGNGGPLTNAPLALDLHYLLTAYGKQAFEAEILLGYAMQILHETPMLAREKIRKTLDPPSPVGGGILPRTRGALAASDLAEQVELIKITPQPMSTEDASKLWTAFQTNYRSSAAYHVSVVLIEGRGPTRSPLPVLTRGKPDPATGREGGIISQADLIPSFPTLQKVIPPDEQPAVRMGEVLTLCGHHLDGDEKVSVAARFTHARSPNTLELPALPGKSSTEFRVQIPDPAFNQATVNVVENRRLLVLPGGSDPKARVTFANAENDQTAEKLLLTTQTKTLKATLSGEHATSPDLYPPASSQVAVTINGRTDTLMLHVPPSAGLADIARVLQSAIREIFPLTTVFADAVVKVVGDRLLVLPGGRDPEARVTFANVESGIENDLTAQKLLLTTEANTLNATLSGKHQAPPDIPASPKIAVTIDGVTCTRKLSFPASVALPGEVSLADIAQALELAIRAAVSDGPTSEPIAADSPQNPDNWQAGVYSVAAVIRRRPDPPEPTTDEPLERTTNELPVVLAPRIDAISAGISGDIVILTVKCSPKVRRTQRVTLVVGDRELAAEPIMPEVTDTLTFESPRLLSGEPRVRLRVDGIDSILVHRSKDKPPNFDDSQKVEIP
jgi:hypothetical protein